MCWPLQMVTPPGPEHSAVGTWAGVDGPGRGGLCRPGRGGLWEVVRAAATAAGAAAAA